MPLKAADAVAQANILRGYRDSEATSLDTIRRFWKGRQSLPAVIPSSAPAEVRTMARIARVNVCSIVVETLAQSCFVDGFRSEREADDLEVWATWQANRMDARQAGIHRAAFAYGAAYAVVMPGDTHPVIRGVGPRQMTAMYGEDPDWPLWALERLGRGLWRLYDDTSVYYLSGGAQDTDLQFLEARPHGSVVTPVVRYVDEHDLDIEDDVDGDMRRPGDAPTCGGQISPLIPLQEQIDLTTFGLLVAQHYGAFRQRYAIGWVADNETQLMKAAASQLWQFADNPADVQLGEFQQTDLTGFLASREASLRHAASLSQTPVHELIGELVNLSAEALAAAEAGKDRKVAERKTNLGEAHEQTLGLVGRLQGLQIPADSQVVWRDTSARAFAATVDGLGKLAALLGIPAQELWERVPGATKQDVDRWLLAKQAAPPPVAPAPVTAPAPAPAPGSSFAAH